MIALWLKGLLRHRLPRLLAGGAGVALAIALVGVIGLFAAASEGTMTRRALAGVPIDWQVGLKPGTDPAAVAALIERSVRPTAVATVDYAAAPGFSAVTGASTQAAGAGLVLGLPPGYLARFPGQVRLLSGRLDGVLLAQQLAANLHVAVGDAVSIGRADGTAAPVTVDGVVEIPNADALLRPVEGARPAAAAAPPDDVILMPAARWQALFGADRPAADRLRQIHVRLDHGALPGDPTAAYATALRQAHGFELAAAGTATLANDLAARLDAVRADALYARLLFLFLGAPGAALAALLTAAVAASGADRRRREQALLRLRGARPAQVLAAAAVEAGLTAAISAAAGVALALALAALFGVPLAGSGGLPILAAAALAGAAGAILTALIPAWRDMRSTVASGRRAAARRLPLWRRLSLDVALLGLSAALFWRTAGSRYQVVLAPEGVAATSTDYLAFVAPLAFWVGGGLAVLRLCGLAIRGGRRWLAPVLGPVAGSLAPVMAPAMARDAARLSAGVAVTALAIAFGIAVAVFDRTYETQARVDAELTNGADVVVKGAAGTPADASLAAIRATPGVAAAEPMQHRFAYVGQDLQDLYGIDPARLGRATSLVDAYAVGGGIDAVLKRLAATPDGVLVSQETVNDYQLAIGDPINLRLARGAGEPLVTVPFHVVGIASEFPTAPRDSFLVANAAYVAAVTGVPGAETVLVRADGPPGAVAAAIRGALGPGSGLTVTDLDTAARIVGSSLTAVDLRRLTAIELAFAVALLAAGTGLVMALGFAERRRDLAILWAFGAPRGLAARFLWAEALLVLALGTAFGLALGFPVAWMLVKLLSGVFDPPPDALSVPWGYVATLLAAAALAVAAAVAWTSSRPRSRLDLGAELPR